MACCTFSDQFLVSFILRCVLVIFLCAKYKGARDTLTRWSFEVHYMDGYFFQAKKMMITHLFTKVSVSKMKLEFGMWHMETTSFFKAHLRFCKLLPKKMLLSDWAERHSRVWRKCYFLHLLVFSNQRDHGSIMGVMALLRFSSSLDCDLDEKRRSVNLPGLQLRPLEKQRVISLPSFHAHFHPLRIDSLHNKIHSCSWSTLHYGRSSVS